MPDQNDSTDPTPSDAHKATFHQWMDEWADKQRAKQPPPKTSGSGRGEGPSLFDSLFGA